MNKKGLVFITAVVLIVGGLFGLNAFLKQKTAEAPSDDGREETTRSFAYKVVVPDQAGGTEVFIEHVSLESPGYVAIHRDKDGTPEAIIGASGTLPAGEHANLIVAVGEEVIEGDVLYAMLHTDDGDEMFDPATDLPAADEAGDVVVTKFVILSEGALEDETKL